MTLPFLPFLALWLAYPGAAGFDRNVPAPNEASEPRRIVILKVDGLNAGLLYRTMRETDTATGKSRLPWFSHIFLEHGTVFENFYTRGISLSAPSWSLLDTGHHAIIRGNVEYDRYTGQVYDYLNFIPFYFSYARSRVVDMPGVEVLDRAGIPLLSDRFPYPERFVSFQNFQRGVHWMTLEQVLKRRFSSKMLLSMAENAGTPPLDQLLAEQTVDELKHAFEQPEVLYLDLFTNEVDHAAHATNQPAALLNVLERLDTLAGQLWSALEASPLAGQTVFVVVSDHGMNNVPGIVSETFSLPDLFNSAEGGGHHVITNRPQLSDYKLRGLDPLIHRVITPSTASFYLAGEASHYPTAWFDIDGNERAAVHLRNNDLNKIHILLLQLVRSDLPPDLRTAAASYVCEIIDRRRAAWSKTAAELKEEMRALERAIAERKALIAREPREWSAEERNRGEDKAARRLAEQLQDWEREHAAYSSYVTHLEALLNLAPDAEHPFHQKISDFVPEFALGDNNTVRDLQHYVVGPSAIGLVADVSGRLDEERSFRYVDYFSLLARQRVRNNPQPALGSRPIDFIAMRLPEDGGQRYWLYGDEDRQLLIRVDGSEQIALQPVRRLVEGRSAEISWIPQPWRSGLPLHLYEDPDLRLPLNASRDAWLSAAHTEREWLEAIHLSKYSNGAIGIIEELSPVAELVPGPAGIDPILLRYERRRRELVQADFHVFAADHWNFNVRFPNPGGNHGAFFRLSTHSVWMMAGSGIRTQVIDEPYDSLSFASTLLKLLGRTPPMPDRVAALN